MPGQDYINSMVANEKGNIANIAETLARLNTPEQQIADALKAYDPNADINAGLTAYRAAPSASTVDQNLGAAGRITLTPTGTGAPAALPVVSKAGMPQASVLSSVFAPAIGAPGSPSGSGIATADGTQSINAPTANQVDPATGRADAAWNLLHGSDAVNVASNVNAGTGAATGYSATDANLAPGIASAPSVAGQVGNINKPGVTQATASLAGTSSVNAATDTVQGQLEKILTSGSPLNTLAETRANQQMNARGLVNSSMAVQAGQAALYDAALPIATADANTYNTTRLANQNVGVQNAGLSTDVSKTNAGASNEAERAAAQIQLSAQTTNAQLYTDVSKFNSDNALKAGIINQDQYNQMQKFNAANKTAASQFGATAANDMAKFNIDEALKAGIINQQQANDMSKYIQDNALKLTAIQLQSDVDIAKFNASQSNDLIKLGMDSQTKTSLATIEANYKTLMQTSASAADLYKQTIANTANILANKDLTGEAKAKALNDNMAQLNEALNIVGSIANLNIGSYIDFGSTDTAAGANPTANEGGTRTNTPGNVRAPDVNALKAQLNSGDVAGVNQQLRDANLLSADALKSAYGATDQDIAYLKSIGVTI